MFLGLPWRLASLFSANAIFASLFISLSSKHFIKSTMITPTYTSDSPDHYLKFAPFIYCLPASAMPAYPSMTPMIRNGAHLHNCVNQSQQTSLPQLKINVVANTLNAYWILTLSPYLSTYDTSTMLNDLMLSHSCCPLCTYRIIAAPSFNYMM